MAAFGSRSAAMVSGILENSLLLPAGAIVGLLWANGALTSYARAAHTLEFAVNDVGMAFFFGLAAKEVFEATLPGGPLSSIPRASAPLLAAIGGMLVPAALYLALAAGLGEPGAAERMGDSVRHRHRLQLPRGAPHLRPRAPGATLPAAPCDRR